MRQQSICRRAARTADGCGEHMASSWCCMCLNLARSRITSTGSTPWKNFTFDDAHSEQSYDMQTHTSSSSIRPQQHTSLELHWLYFHIYVTLISDLLNSKSMHAGQLPWSLCVKVVVFIAQAVFLLEHAYTLRPTCKVTDSSYHPIQLIGYTWVQICEDYI